jgi:hypothetical protein
VIANSGKWLRHANPISKAAFRPMTPTLADVNSK